MSRTSRTITAFEAGLIAGGIGDIGLQLADKTSMGNTGLKPYFAGQTPLTSVGRAASLTALWSAAYTIAGGESLIGFMGFAGVLDLVYREFHGDLGFKDLDGYYDNNSTLATVAYNMAAAVAVFKVKYFLESSK